MGNEKVNSGLRLRLHDEWRWIVGHAWSFRLLGAAAVLSGAQAALPLFMDHPPLPRRIFAVVVFLIVSFAMIANLIVAERPPVVLAPDLETEPAAPHIVPSTVIVAQTADGKPVTGHTVPTITQPPPVTAPEPAPPAAPAQAPVIPAVHQ